MSDESLDGFAILRQTVPAAVVLHVSFQKKLLSQLTLYPVNTGFRQRGCNPAAEQGMQYFDRSPTVLFHTVEGEIIRVLPVIEKLELFETAQDCLYLLSIRLQTELCFQLSPAVGTARKQTSRFLEQYLR